MIGRPFAPGLIALVLLAFGCCTASAASFADVSARIETGDYDGARSLIAELPGSPEIQALNRQFLEALILRQQGRRAEAIDAMRAIIDAHPEFARVRHELAATLMEAEDWDGASYQLDLLARSTTDSVLRSTYQGYLRAIASNRPWNFQASFGLLPSSNINNATHDQVVLINGLPFHPTTTAVSGVGARFGLSGSYRFDLDDSLAFTVGAQASGRVYQQHDYDQLLAGTFAELAWQSDTLRIGGGLGVERALSGWQGVRTSLGPQGAIAYSFGSAGTVTVSGQARQHFYDAGGTEQDIRGGVSYSLPVGNAAAASIGVELSRTWTAMPHNQYVAGRAWVGFGAELPLGLIANARLSYELRDYEAIVPGLSRDKDETRIEASLGVTFKGLAIAGFAPQLEYTYALSDSGIDVYDVESHTVALTMTKAF